MQKVAIICEREDFKDLEEMNTLVNCIMQHPEYEITINYEEADLIIISCAGWQIHKVRDIQVIADVLYNKKETANIIVTGELAKRKLQVKKDLPYVDVYTLKELYKFFGGMPKEVKRYTKHNAVVITTGCQHHCSYCLYPLIENQYVSKTMEQILQEVGELYESEVVIHITGALETGDYGVDLYGKRMFATLLETICTQYPNCEYAILKLHPDGLTDELVKVIRRNHNISYLDISMEHADGMLLQKMNRPNWEATSEKLQKLQQARPDLSISTNVILGFPGENEFAHKKLCQALQAIKWEHIQINEYEKVQGTQSGMVFDKIPVEIKEKRRQELIEKVAPYTQQFYLQPFSVETQYPITSVYESACFSLDVWSSNMHTAKYRQKHDYIAGTDTMQKLEGRWQDAAEEVGTQIIELRDTYMIENTRTLVQETLTMPYREVVQEMIETIEGKPALAKKARHILLE